MTRLVEKLVGTCIVGAALALAAPPAIGAAARQKPTRYRLDVPNSGIDVGAAKVSVRASAEDVQKAVLRYNDYSSMISKFKRSKIVGKSGESTDVYLQVPILKGIAKVWAIVRFAPPRHEGGTVVVEGRMLKGNVDELTAEWRILPVSTGKTELHLRMRIVPKIPAPGGLVTDEVAYAADQAVRGIRAAAESK